jgi:predicted PolB exonuclease-like 3'-5' exonuclease
MKKNPLVIDIETVPDPDCIPLLKTPEPDGRIKDPAKIAADIAKKRQQQIADMWKNPKQNIPICIGWRDAETSGSFFLPYAHHQSLDAQAVLLREFWDFAAGYDYFITFNGISFDIPCLLLRSLKTKVKPTIKIDMGMYRVLNHLDIRMILGNWDRFAPGSLDYYMKYFDLSPGKQGLDGSMVQTFYHMGERGEAVIKQYCVDGDCRDTWLLYERIRDFMII